MQLIWETKFTSLKAYVHHLFLESSFCVRCSLLSVYRSSYFSREVYFIGDSKIHFLTVGSGKFIPSSFGKVGMKFIFCQKEVQFITQEDYCPNLNTSFAITNLNT
jgi:hypothetical protein